MLFETMHPVYGFVPVYGDEAAPIEPAAPVEPVEPVEPAVPKPETITLEEHSKLLQEAKTEAIQQQVTTIASLEKRQGLTKNERDVLAKQKEELTKQLLTKEELAIENETKLRTDYEEKLAGLETERNEWQTRYTEETVNRSIIDEASKAEAYNPSQFVALLRPMSIMTQNESGKFDIRVSYPATKDGKPIELDLSVEEAIAKMSEAKEYLNLFKANAAGGLGGTNKGSGISVDIHEIAKDPAKYREWKKRQSGKSNG